MHFCACGFSPNTAGEVESAAGDEDTSRRPDDQAEGGDEEEEAEADENKDEDEDEDVDDEGDDDDDEVDSRAGKEKSVNQSRGAGVTANVKNEDFFWRPVDDNDLANENEDVSLTIFGGDAADDEHAMAQARADSSVYFESGSKGVFHRKRQGGKDEKGLSRAGARSDKDEDFLKNFLDFVASLIASSFIFCQGLLGGMGLIMLYFSANQTDREMLSSFSPIADDVQKAFTFLSSFALIGALDKYSKDHMAAWMARGAAQRAYDALLIALYFACFISTLACTPMDDVMFASHLRSPEWHRWELGPEFRRQLASWKVGHLLRCLCGLLGWLASSWETRNYLNNAPNKILHEIYEQAYGSRAGHS